MSEAKRVFPSGKKTEVFYAVISQGVPLFRTEGVGDVSTFNVVVKDQVYELPVILPEKVQAKLRRILLEKLRRSYQSLPKDFKMKVLERASAMGYKRAKEEWNCYVAPPMERTSSTDVGMCGYCPSCTVLGNITDSSMKDNISTTYGVKSRVVHDVAFALTDVRRGVAEVTHNKVSDGVSYTGQSLYADMHVVPGVVFVGKLAMYDLTEEEEKAILDSLSSISRMGGGETKYGSVKIVILGCKDGDRETLSSYDVMREMMKEHQGKLLDSDVIVDELKGFVKGKGFKECNVGEVKYEKLWEDSLEFASDMDKMIASVDDKLRKGREGGHGKKPK